MAAGSSETSVLTYKPKHKSLRFATVLRLCFPFLLRVLSCFQLCVRATAVLHCVIPAFVKDYVTVTSWFRDDTIILPARDDAGKWMHLHCEK